ncbi:MAG: PEP-CTERM sorting domain-containing protein [Pirellulaceae bacterium]
MKNSFSKTILALAIACGLCVQIALPNSSRAEEKTMVGTPGTNGIDGANGNPGVDGTAGGTGGFASAVTLTGNARSSAFGGKGGKGGKGGNGTGSTADGGQGGDGGRGGGADASATTSAAGATAFARALGGLGGNGGNGGTPGSSAIPGFGGTGGGGGNAVARAVGVRAATAIAVGGNSGFSGGQPFSNSFAGGAAQASAVAVNTAGAVTVIARQFGGVGGNSGGNGANSALNNSVSGSASTNLVFEQSARGGGGGAGIDGVGGNGGYAFSGFSMDTLNSVGAMSGTVSAIGGNGGRSELAPYSAGNGGNAAVSFYSDNQIQNVSMRAIGGHAGSHLLGSVGGNGGIAYQDVSRAIIQNGADLEYRTTLVGGNGGSALTNTKLGFAKGGSATSINAFTFDSSGASAGANSLRMIMNLSGGKAGSFGDVDSKDRYVGLGGQAIYRSMDNAGALSKFFRANAFGGGGADFVKADPLSTLDWAGGNGGSAEVDINSTNAKGGVTIEANARGGDIGAGGVQLVSPLGFLGFGGGALAKGYGESSAAGQDVKVVAKSQGGRGLDIPELNGGGGAKSYATAIGTANNATMASAFSKAINSSDVSLAQATSTSSLGSATATAGADGGPADGIIDVLGTIARSTAAATAEQSTAIANSSAVAGNIQSAFSDATANGADAAATSNATGGDTRWSIDGLRGGNANAKATANSGDVGLATSTTANATAKGGDMIAGTPAVMGVGGFAVSNATATSISTVGGSVESRSLAIAGRGSNSATSMGRDGRSDAFASSNLSGQLGSTLAVAESQSTFFGSAQAVANGGQSANADAEVSRGGGGFSQAFATSNNADSAISVAAARFVGPSTTLGAARGTVRAESETMGTGVQSAKIAVSGIVDAFDGSITNFGTAQAIVGHNRSTDALGIVVESSSAFSHYQIAPSAALTDALLADNTSVRDEFDTIYGVGLLGNSAGIETAFRSKFDLSMDLLGGDDQLRVGFFDKSSTGIGFDTLRLMVTVEDNLVIDETFLNLAAADAYFADQVISIGAASSVVGPLNFEVEWLMNTNATSSYFTGLVFGSTSLPPSFISSVPEPGSLGLMTLIVCGLAVRRRKRV